VDCSDCGGLAARPWVDPGPDNEISSATNLGLSARAHDKVLRVARTIADLEGSDGIKPQHLAEGVGYRSLDRSVWT
jgi:predicted ATPase with chaperone activity